MGGAVSTKRSINITRLKVGERVQYLKCTPFFLYMSTDILHEFAKECFTSALLIKDMETIPIKSDSIYVIADGEIELSTIIPSENTKVDNLGYLCKKRPGDIVNKRQTQKEAVRKISMKNKKLEHLVEDVQTKARSRVILLRGDLKLIDSFLSNHPDLSKSINSIFHSDIEACLSSLPFLSGVKESQLTLLAAMCRYEALDAKQTVFEEGSEGSKLYIVLSGVTSVLAGNNGVKPQTDGSSDGKSKKATALQRSMEWSSAKKEENNGKAEDEKEVLLADLKHGDYFGETALFFNIPRTTTVKTKEKTLLVTVDKTDFENFLKVCPIKESMTTVMKERMVGKLSTLGIPFLEGIPAVKLNSLTSSVEIHNMSDGQVVFREGDAGDQFYIIVHGEVVVEARSSENKGGSSDRDDSQIHDSKSMSLGNLGPGKYFGEMALVNDSHRSATVTSKGKSILLSVDKESFHNIFGSNSQALVEFELRLLQGSAELHHLLAHSMGLSSFRSFLQKGLAEENIDFWVKAKEFSEAKFPSTEDGIAEAKNIFHLYCDETSEKQINLPCNIRTKLKDCLEKNELNQCMFEPARMEIYRLMVRDNYARYKVSSDFKEFFGRLGLISD
mmetsp:Transcript_27239/g.40085  ORF Transcript_27239/g.40085 Transcript_27239/m.40085 type:complete len:615 (-) Transcript_27239:563-2407(-)